VFFALRRGPAGGLEGLVSKRLDRPYRGGRVEGLGQGEKQVASGDGTGDGGVGSRAEPGQGLQGNTMNGVGRRTLVCMAVIPVLAMVWTIVY
jgi:hypothetical protein